MSATPSKITRNTKLFFCIRIPFQKFNIQIFISIRISLVLLELSLLVSPSPARARRFQLLPAAGSIVFLPKFIEQRSRLLKSACLLVCLSRLVAHPNLQVYVPCFHKQHLALKPRGFCCKRLLFRFIHGCTFPKFCPPASSQASASSHPASSSWGRPLPCALSRKSLPGACG